MTHEPDQLDLGSYFAAVSWARSVMADAVIARRWSMPSTLARFSVGGLAAHLVQSGVARLERLLAETEPTGANLVDLATFYGVHRIDGPGDLDGDLPTLVRRMAEDQARRGPASMLRSLDDRIGRLRPVLEAVSPSRLVPVMAVPGAVIDLATYIETRVVELVVHGDDLRASVASADTQPAPPLPESAATVALRVLVSVARRRSGDMTLLRVFARRERADPSALLVF